MKGFSLELGRPDFHFLPGQWVDCYVEIDGRAEVAGYSLTSSPLVEGTIELAVKDIGRNPVTQFLHHRARAGHVVHIDGAQGDFVYQRGIGDSLVLIAGGIGITPVMSIIRDADEAATDASATLLYCARTPEELLFRGQLDSISARNPRIGCVYTVTRPAGTPWSGNAGRIDSALLERAQLDKRALFYVCRPPAMITYMLCLLGEFAVPHSRIKYEKWFDSA